jgi:DNA-binding NarL/FixJ family response regulator
MAKTTILIVDDHAIVREGVRMILAKEADLEVVGEAADGAEAFDLTKRLQPQVVVMDISMPGMGGIEATQTIRETYPDVQVLALTMHEDETYVFQLLRAGSARRPRISCRRCGPRRRAKPSSIPRWPGRWSRTT